MNLTSINTSSSSSLSVTSGLYIAEFMKGQQPLASGAQTFEIVMPYGTGNVSRTWNLIEFDILVGTSATGTTSFAIEKYTGTGQFSASVTSQTFTLSAASISSITTAIFPVFTANSGDKIRLNITAISDAVWYQIKAKFTSGSNDSTLIVPLMLDYTPVGTGGDSLEVTLPPYPTGSFATYRASQIIFRQKTTGSSSSQLKVELCIGDTTFTASDATSTITIATSAYETTYQPTNSLTASPGDKLRVNVVQIGTSSTNWSVWIEYSIV